MVHGGAVEYTGGGGGGRQPGGGGAYPGGSGLACGGGITGRGGGYGPRYGPIGGCVISPRSPKLLVNQRGPRGSIWLLHYPPQRVSEKGDPRRRVGCLHGFLGRAARLSVDPAATPRPPAD